MPTLIELRDRFELPHESDGQDGWNVRCPVCPDDDGQPSLHLVLDDDHYRVTCVARDRVTGIARDCPLSWILNRAKPPLSPADLVVPEKDVVGERHPFTARTKADRATESAAPTTEEIPASADRPEPRADAGDAPMTAGAPTPTLHPDHLDDLRKSGLTDDTIRNTGCFSLDPQDWARVFGDRIAGHLLSVLAIPYPAWHPDDAPFVRYKLFPPVPTDDGHHMRYFQPPGTPCRLYVPPRAMAARQDPSAELVIVEGEKKAVAGDQAGLTCVAVGGLWNWILDGEPIPDLAAFEWIGRRVRLAPDADVWERRRKDDPRKRDDHLLLALYAFVKELESMGAHVSVGKLPPATKGLDDYLLVQAASALPTLPWLTVKDFPLSRVAERWTAWRARRRPLDGVAADAPNAPNPWRAAMSATDFLGEPEVQSDFLEPRQLARGSVTEWFSPRGLGKTLLAHALAATLARAGFRVLLIDRDNARREVKRRLRAWGVEDCLNFKVLTRDVAPPLTDRAAWTRFPLPDYDIILVDSLDASSEGVGEQDSAKPSKAIASILDVARVADGPAILVLGNTIKSGTHGRGSGVIEDRADIVYEVRDATGLQPTGTKPWWLELPAAGRADWGASAARRKRRETYRLAFVPTKFRIGEIPDPYIVELDLRETPWRYREVTADIEVAGQAARVAADAERLAARERAVAALLTELARRTASGQADLGKQAAEALLQAHGLTRKTARELLQAEVGLRWYLVPDEDDARKINVRLSEEKIARPHLPPSEFQHPERGFEAPMRPSCAQSSGRISSASIPAPDAAPETPHMRPPVPERDGRIECEIPAPDAAPESQKIPPSSFTFRPDEGPEERL